MMIKPLTIATLLALALTAGLPIQTAQAQDEPSLWGLTMINAEKAWEQGFFGNGVVVGVMDTPIWHDHPEFADRWQAGINVDSTSYRVPADTEHGTHVTGTIGGRNVGVAPGTLIYGINLIAANRTDDTNAHGIRWATSQGIRFQNNSWGINIWDPITDTVHDLTILDRPKEQFERFRPALLQALHESVSADIVQIFATGNDAFDQPGVLAGLPYFFPELQSNWIAVTAVGPTGSKASYAQLCGLAAAWCIAAPGGEDTGYLNDEIWSSWPPDLYSVLIGTSMATPHVTGALAISAEIFPQASGSQLTQLVLQSATDIGEKGIDATYGWGLLNVGNIVETINPATAGTYANAAWSRMAALATINTAMRQRLGSTAPSQTGSQNFSAPDYAPPIWLAPIYGTASIPAGPRSYGAGNKTGGLLAGVDIVHDANAQFGLALGYSHTDLTTRKIADKAGTDTAHLGAYGAWQKNGLFIRGSGQAALFKQSIERHAISGAVGLSFDPVGQTTLTGSAFDLSAQVGHQIAFPDGLTISPYLAAAANWHATRASQESGAGIFNLSLPATRYASFEAGPGVRIASAPILLEDNTINMSIDFSYALTGGNTDNKTTVNLLGRDPWPQRRTRAKRLAH